MGTDNTQEANDTVFSKLFVHRSKIIYLRSSFGANVPHRVTWSSGRAVPPASTAKWEKPRFCFGCTSNPEMIKTWGLTPEKY